MIIDLHDAVVQQFEALSGCFDHDDMASMSEFSIERLYEEEVAQVFNGLTGKWEDAPKNLTVGAFVKAEWLLDENEENAIVVEENHWLHGADYSADRIPDTV